MSEYTHLFTIEYTVRTDVEPADKEGDMPRSGTQSKYLCVHSLLKRGSGLNSTFCGKGQGEM